MPRFKRFVLVVLDASQSVSTEDSALLNQVANRAAIVEFAAKLA